MNLLDLHENKKSKLATRVLKETFNTKLNLNKLTVKETRTMLTKVRNLISETRTSRKNHVSQNNPEYLKLIMLEQVLSGHLNDIRQYSRIVIENEEVQKSQVILAAQDMIDSIQKMVEQISKMNVEELPAVVQGIENEIGVNESEQFSSSVSENLKNLQAALETSRAGLNDALGVITGQAPAEVSSSELEAPVAPEMEMPMDGEELPEPEEETEVSSNLGRERR